MDKSALILKVVCYLLGMAACVSIVPLQILLHKHYPNSLWVLLGIFQLLTGLALIHLGTNLHCGTCKTSAKNNHNA